MTPAQITMLTDIAKIVSNIGTWPIGSILVTVVLFPWIVLGLVSRSMERRFEAANKMYESNVALVECYEKMAKEQADTIRLATSATVELTTYLKNQVPCYQRMSERYGQL